MKILIVTDGLKRADYIEGQLREHEHRALSLQSPYDALHHLKHIWFDLVILDECNAKLAQRILGELLHPEVMLVDGQEVLDQLPTKVEEIESRLAREWQQALEFLQGECGETGGSP